ncbi:MAG: FAD-dependent monooxygenase [Candidatus Rokubacteria bacterium]|nr:FAD-dependent monooxygenase [Candidatus Rokubacteria bacterium]
MRYDLIIVGGGLAGSALAKGMAEGGARVLVLEREREFRDRIRGEGMHPWGVPEVRALGVYDALKAGGAVDIPWWASYRDGALMTRRDLIKTTQSRTGALNFSHPAMQETLLRRAAAAGAEVRRGAGVTMVSPGNPPSVLLGQDGRTETLEARVVVGADGRRSQVRRWGGFKIHQDPKWLAISGVLLTGMRAEDDAVHVFRPSWFGQSVLLFPLGGARCRAYFATGRRSDHSWLSGSGHLPEFVTRCVESGVPAEWFSGAELAGPLATFEGADSWAESPYKNGVVLVGDAAASSDPCWGCGLSLMFRDVRTLRDRLVSTEDWHTAASQYALEHDKYYGALRTIVSWLRTVLYGLGSDADRIRAHALPRFADGLGPDLVGRGPDNPADEAARIRFLGV